MGVRFNEFKNRVARVSALRQRLFVALNSEEALEQKVREESKNLEKAHALRAMEKLSVERIRDATSRTIKVEYLKRSGFENMRQIYEARASRIEAISGISAEVAVEIKEIAEAMYGAILATANLQISAELSDPNEEALVSALEQLNSVRSELKPVQQEVPKVVAALDSAHEEAKRVGRRVQWWFGKRENRERAINSVDLALAMHGIPGTKALFDAAERIVEKILVEKRSKAALKDAFAKNSSDYYAILESLEVGRKPHEGFQHLSDELIEQIEKCEFDHGLINATLRKYQIFGIKFALTQKRTILGDEMGLGKTLQALGLLTERRKAGAQQFLVVVPASVIINWQRELENRTSFTPLRIHGEGQNQSLSLWLQAGGLALTTFDTLKNLGLTDEQVAGISLDTLIVDEAHFAKNLHTGRSKEVKRWVARAEYALFLTGTPMENRVEEFMGLVGLINPVIAKQLDTAVLAAGPEPFKVAVASVYLRRNSSEVLSELPDLIEKEELCSWVGVDRSFYENSVRSNNFMALRRAAYVPIPGYKPSKVERLLELVAEAEEENEKVLVFTFFRSVLTYLEQELGDKTLEPITGSTPPKRRQEIVDQFNAHQGSKVLLGQIQAAGTGLNIQSASVVILCEPQIKPTLESQAIARAHRMGQVRKVQVHRLIIENSVDQTLRAMLRRKVEEFDTYARESLLADGSSLAKDTKDLSEDSIAKSVLSIEREKLGLSPSFNSVVTAELDDEQI